MILLKYPCTCSLPVYSGIVIYNYYCIFHVFILPFSQAAKLLVGLRAVRLTPARSPKVLGTVSVMFLAMTLETAVVI